MVLSGDEEAKEELRFDNLSDTDAQQLLWTLVSSWCMKLGENCEGWFDRRRRGTVAGRPQGNCCYRDPLCFSNPEFSLKIVTSTAGGLDHLRMGTCAGREVC
ncbi:hypothetical protein MLD38_027758 [Melastoma candidum]|uniref:Uncharacterized protein n=1 Tax=Melastoma candidum TaxID=119954 RepID=A0ACB9P3P4_9MYRT|nr:hypothetical protein MLD38_027758 [Melastoma candidum]